MDVFKISVPNGIAVGTFDNTIVYYLYLSTLMSECIGSPGWLDAHKHIVHTHELAQINADGFSYFLDICTQSKKTLHVVRLNYTERKTAVRKGYCIESKNVHPFIKTYFIL